VITRLIRQRDSEELVDARQVLLAERNRLLDEAAALAGRERLYAEVQRPTGGGDGAGSDDADIATEAFEQELAAFLSRNVQAHLEEVNDALARLEEDSFGLCADCGEEINPDRLGALPWARRCIVCQGLLEHPVRQARRPRRLAAA